MELLEEIFKCLWHEELLPIALVSRRFRQAAVEPRVLYSRINIRPGMARKWRDHLRGRSPSLGTRTLFALLLSIFSAADAF